MINYIKYYTLIVALVLLAHVSYSQTFSGFIQSNEDDWCGKGLELKQGGYLLLAQRGQYGNGQDPSRINYRDIFFRLDAGGNVTDSLVINDQPNRYIRIWGVFQTNSGFLAWGRVSKSESVGDGLYLLWINNELEFNRDTCIYGPGLKRYYASAIINRAGNLVFSAVQDSLDSKGINSVYLCQEYTLNAELVNEQVYTEPCVGNFITELPASGGYHIGDFFTIWQIDYSLQCQGLLYQKTPDDEFHWQLERKRLSDSTYAVVGWKFESWPLIGKDFALAILDDEAGRLAFYSAGLPDTTDQFGFIDFISPDSIFGGGTSNYDFVGMDYFQYQDRWFLVYNTNQEGEEHWKCYYGGEGDYSLHELIATQDGGCLLVGTYWDWRNNPNREKDIFLLKVDRTGYFDPLGFPGEPGRLPFVVYPNPGSDYICLKSFGESGVFELSDSNGRVVLRKDIQKNNSKIPTAHLPMGTYIYKLTGKNGLISSGKWIKN